MQSPEGVDRKDLAKNDKELNGRETFVVSMVLQGTAPVTVQFKLGPPMS